MIPDQFLDSETEEKPRRKPQKLKAKAPKPYRNPGLGFRFSPSDNLRIALARISAKRYMQSYGKGRDINDIDHSHYFPGLNTEQWNQPQPTE